MPKNIAEKSRQLGSFTCDGVMWVTDPCYDRNLTAGGLQARLDVLPGTWQGYVDYEDCGNWGRRVKQITAYNIIGPSLLVWQDDYNGEIAVDSGQCGFFDDKEFVGRTDTPETESWYEKICNMTCSDNQAGILGGGVVSSSGYGDGGYRLLIARNAADDICGLRVVFMPDDEDDGCYCDH